MFPAQNSATVPSAIGLSFPVGGRVLSTIPFYQLGMFGQACDPYTQEAVARESRVQARAENIAHLVSYLPFKHRDLSLIPRTHIRKSQAW